MANEAYIFSLPLLPITTEHALFYGSILVVLLFLLVGSYFIRGKRSSKGRTVLLIGNEDAGKTAIMSALAYEHALPTQTSQQLNSAFLPSAKSQKKVLEVVDVPGHPRLRGSFKSFVSDAKAIIFVVDASTITRRAAEVAEYMHHVLHTITSLPPSHRVPPLLVLAHKADLLASSSAQSPAERTAIAVSRVRTVLERELEKRRTAVASGVAIESLGAEAEGSELGGLDCLTPGRAFQFGDWEGGDVEFFGTWVKIQKQGLSEKGLNEKMEDAHGVEGLDGLRIWLDGLS